MLLPSLPTRRFLRALPRLAGLGLLLWAAVVRPCAGAELVLAVGRSLMALPVQVAHQQGYFAAEGITVRLVDCDGGVGCLGRLFDGSAQLATSSELPVVFSSFERADAVIVATLATSTHNIRLVARKSAVIDGPQQFPVKRIGVAVGSSAQYLLDLCLLLHGVDPHQLRIVPMSAERLAGAMQRKEIDAFAGYSRQAWQAMKALGSDAIVLDEPGMYTERHNLNAARRALAERPEDIVKALRAIERAQQFIAQQPQRAKALMQTNSGTEAAFIETVFPIFEFRLSLDQSLIGTMEGQARWALREGHVGPGSKPANLLQFVEFAPLRAAVPNAVSR
jgi:NitT/TauT family transport system substrate-binding protein